MMLKSMRDANSSFSEGSMFSSAQGDFYQDMFDEQISMELSKGKGLGLADMLVRQLAHAGMVNETAAVARQKQRSPRRRRMFPPPPTISRSRRPKEDFVKHDVAACAACR